MIDEFEAEGEDGFYFIFGFLDVEHEGVIVVGVIECYVDLD